MNQQIIPEDVLETVRNSGIQPPAGRVLAVTFQANAYDKVDEIRRLRNELGEVGMFVPVLIPFYDDRNALFGIRGDAQPISLLLAPHGAGRDLTDPARYLGVDIDDMTYKIVSLEVEAIDAVYFAP